MSGRNSPGENKVRSTDAASKPELPKTAKKVQTRFDVKAPAPVAGVQKTEDVEGGDQVAPAKNSEAIDQGDAQ